VRKNLIKEKRQQVFSDLIVKAVLRGGWQTH
jgi:hypothetical protein